MSADPWPPLPYAQWADTCETLHMWMQVVGKIRMEKTPPVNHTWHVTLYVTSRGIGTSPIPDGARTFDIDFDFVAHRLCIATSDGQRRELALRPMSVAAFYADVMAALRGLGIEATINTMPSEVANPVRFEEDTQHASYDPEAAARFWRVLVSVCRVMNRFRSRFIGKVSPAHLFWGGFDLAVTRFSGRLAPDHPAMPGLPLWVVRDAYSHEVSSAGFWPGTEGADAVFYSYAYPEPAGYADWPVRPAGTFYSPDMREFLLPYEAVRTAPSPDDALLEFFQSTYEAAAERGEWARAQLER